MTRSSEPAKSKPAAPTPMMAQYLEIKAAHSDSLLFYRMGDFFEMFFEDAVAAAEALDIALTARGTHEGLPIPMCGVPVARAESYLETLIRKGFRVAIAEQTEDPAEAKKRGGAKAVVAREVVRVVTPGTITEEALLPARAANRLAAWSEIRGEGALAWVELSTGEVAVAVLDPKALGPLLARLAPSEVLVRQESAAADDIRTRIEEVGAVASPVAASAFETVAAADRLARLYKVATLESFAPFTRVEVSALGAIASYLELTQKGRLPLLRPPRREATSDAMVIDAATRRNLEIARTLSGSRSGSLLDAVDRTVTGVGARLLEARLAAPLIDPAAIAGRQEAVAAFLSDPDVRDDVRARLRAVPDMERALTRIALERAAPRDADAVRRGLSAAGGLRSALLGSPAAEALPAASLAALADHEPLVQRLDDTLADDLPATLADGGVIGDGVDDELDEARCLRREGRGVIAGMQADYAAETGIASLKVRHNNVLGYFIETTAAHGERMRADPRFIHRQTLANAVRFTTPDLSDLENRIVTAAGRAMEIERRIFSELCADILAAQRAILAAANAFAVIDVAAASAALAAEADWCRPTLRDDRSFRIEAGRHPVVEAALAKRGDTAFVANDCDLSAEAEGPAPLVLLTGPNMAGKSTYLRQNALIALLAQAGLNVPAARAEIGIVDRLFSRVGAADDLAAGRSTFMVEMVETAAILNQAGPRSLVILDEIGRGTATYDGLSIAWAVLEHLHDSIGCRGLFATHYHELVALKDRLAALHPATVAVREWEGEVIFLHEVRPGSADRSYGVQVARLAGLPETVTLRARDVLDRLEQGEREGGPADLLAGLPLFSAARPAPQTAAPAPKATTELEELLAAADPDAMTPREALELVYALKAISAGRPDGSSGGRQDA